MTNLTFSRCLTFRTAFADRAAALQRATGSARLGAALVEEIGNRIVARLACAGAIEGHGLAVDPRGIGDMEWRRLVEGEVRAAGRGVLLQRSVEPVGLVHAAASATRAALHDAQLGDLKTKSEVCWDALEAVAYAKMFCPRSRWHAELAPAAVLAPSISDGHAEGWVRVLCGVALDQARLRDVSLWRHLRHSYDTYVTFGASQDFVMPRRARRADAGVEQPTSMRAAA